MPLRSFTDESGRVFNTESATPLGTATTGDGIEESLWRTSKKGVYVHEIVSEKGGRSCVEVSPELAAMWLMNNSIELPDELAEYAEEV